MNYSVATKKFWDTSLDDLSVKKSSSHSVLDHQGYFQDAFLGLLSTLYALLSMGELNTSTPSETSPPTLCSLSQMALYHDCQIPAARLLSSRCSLGDTWYSTCLQVKSLLHHTELRRLVSHVLERLPNLPLSLHCFSGNPLCQPTSISLFHILHPAHIHIHIYTPNTPQIHIWH